MLVNINSAKRAGLNIEEMCDDLLVNGAHHRPNFLSDELRQQLLRAVRDLDFVTLPRVVGKHRVRQQIECAEVVPVDGLIGQFCRGFSDLLKTGLREQFRFIPTSDRSLCLQPDVIRYPVGSIGIDIHRDANKHLVCLFTLEGRARLGIHKDRKDNDPVEFICQPGDLVLLAGTGFLGQPRGREPLHSVRGVKGPRTVLTLKGPSTLNNSGS